MTLKDQDRRVVSTCSHQWTLPLLYQESVRDEVDPAQLEHAQHHRPKNEPLEMTLSALGQAVPPPHARFSLFFESSFDQVGLFVLGKRHL